MMQTKFMPSKEIVIASSSRVLQFSHRLLLTMDMCL